jgi:ribonuclease HI
MVYASKPEEEESEEKHEAWLLLEQTVLNARALALDALSFANELRQEHALKATISPSYHKSPEKEEVFGDELHQTIKAENETNKLLNDAAWQRKRSFQSSYKNQKYSNSNTNFKQQSRSGYSSGYSKHKPHKGGYHSNNKKYSGNEFQAGQTGQPILSPKLRPIPSIKIAGRLRKFKKHWVRSFGTTWATKIVTNGYSPEWHTLPPLRRIPISRRQYSDSDISIYQSEIQNLLESGAIQEIDPNIPCFTSALFLVPKKNGDLRPVIDLRKLNQYVQYHHFKMEGLDLVKSLLRRNDYMVSIDLNQAFYHVPLAPSQTQYFAFDFLAKRYCFKCLPFGLTTSPRIFTKILKPLIKLARAQGIRVVAYLDDLLIMARTKQEALTHLNSLITCLQNHGFTINEKKSCLDPSQVIDYLGFRIDSKKMVLKLPNQKIRGLIRECKKAKTLKVLPVRKLASLIGKIIATANAMFPAKLHSRALLRDKNLSLQQEGWNGKVYLSEESLAQLEWWIQELPSWNGRSLLPENPKNVIYTDASNTGWGASLNLQQTIHGHWNLREQQMHINRLELKAIYFAIRAFKEIENQTVLIKTDNTTCIAYINHQGGTTSVILSRIAEKLWKLCLKRKIILRAEHVPGVHNVLADQASRLTHDRHDWQLEPKTFHQLNHLWGPFQIDLFANRTNNQLPKFYSWIPDPFATATDALRQNWRKQNLWANPPWILIPRILSKVIREKATITLLAPLWESAPWFPLLMDLIIEPPILLKSPKILFPTQLVHHQHPLRNPKWSIFVCKVSGHGLKRKAFLKKLSNYSNHQWTQTLRKRCPQISNNGYLGVNENRWTPLFAL